MSCFVLRVCVLDKPVLSVSVELVPCTQVSMELFDPIYSCGILRPSGHVVKCIHDFNPDYDELRQVNLSSFDLSNCFDAESIQFLLFYFIFLLLPDVTGRGF